MALRTLGTTATTTLACLTSWSQVLLPADVGNIDVSIADDRGFAALLSGGSAGTTYVLTTATTAGTTSLTVVTASGGSPPVTQIQVGDLVLGNAADIAPGTFVTAFSGTTATLSKAAISSGASKRVAFLRRSTQPMGSVSLNDSQLFIPGRGVLRVLPGDIVAIDSTGWPILVSANAVSYAGSGWTLT